MLQSVIFLTVLFIIQCGESQNRTFYVAPQISSCPDVNFTVPCQGLNHYHSSNEFGNFTVNEQIIINFMPGVHEIVKSTPEKTKLRFCCQETLQLNGHGQAREVVLKDVDCRFITGNITIRNITVHGKHITMYRVEFLYRSLVVINCRFISVQTVAPNVHMVIDNSEIVNSSSTAVKLYSGYITLSNRVSFRNNAGERGGALALIGSIMSISDGANILFYNNSAQKVGGAIFADNVEPRIDLANYRSSCFYLLQFMNRELTQRLNFTNNKSVQGGDHIYGTSVRSDCISTSPSDGDNSRFSYQTINETFLFHPDIRSSWSAVSGDPTRVCICGSEHRPECTNITRIFYTDKVVYPGKSFSISAVLVGGDFGTVTGAVYADFRNNDGSRSLGNKKQRIQMVTSNNQCTNFTYSVLSNDSFEVIYLTATNNTYSSLDPHTLEAHIDKYRENGVTDHELLTIPIVINVTLGSCPLGLVLTGDPPGCNCSPALLNVSVKCGIEDDNSNITWDGPVWVGTVNQSIAIARSCPVDNCKLGTKTVNLETNPDDQCAFGHAGRLCGGCKQNYSVAIGSSHCIYCLNNNNLALLIFFAAAGPLLVLFIRALNLTVTQGMINGLIFYANVIWTYENAFFPQYPRGITIVLRTFIAWLNLDFGIQACFYNGLQMYTKTWLQFLFPLYTATIFFIGVHYSSKLSKLFGNRSVPTLATLLFLSYTKLIRTIAAVLSLAYLEVHLNKHFIRVWARDGSLMYTSHKHAILLAFSLGCLLLLWLPYTVLVFSMQWLRKIDHYQPLKHIARYKPVFDAYYGPLNDRHQYWFGVLLLAQGVLLLTASLTLTQLPVFSLLFLLSTVMILFCYINHIKPHKKLSTSLIESSFLVNLTALISGNLYFKSSEYEKGQEVLLGISISVAFIEFCGIIIWNLMPQKVKQYRRGNAKKSSGEILLETLEHINHSKEHTLRSDDEEEPYSRYRDSIIDQ